MQHRDGEESRANTGGGSIFSADAEPGPGKRRHDGRTGGLPRRMGPAPRRRITLDEAITGKPTY
jgi:hypothetical protein